MSSHTCPHCGIQITINFGSEFTEDDTTDTTVQKRQTGIFQKILNKLLDERSQINKNMSSSSYDNYKEPVLEDGDVIIGKVTPIRPFRDSSKYYGSYGFSNMNAILSHSGGYDIQKMKIRTERVPIVGDKFISSATNMASIAQDKIDLQKFVLPYD